MQPKNILMIGPTGVGKTEIARRVARIVDAPFIKVEATKFTEVGYVGRDVESIIRDLVEVAISNLHSSASSRSRKRRQSCRAAAGRSACRSDDPEAPARQRRSSSTKRSEAANDEQRQAPKARERKRIARLLTENAARRRDGRDRDRRAEIRGEYDADFVGGHSSGRPLRHRPGRARQPACRGGRCAGGFRSARRGGS